MRKLWLVCAVLSLAAGPASATTFVWTNAATAGGGRDWQTGTNWDQLGMPGVTDDAVIVNGGQAVSTVNVDVGSLRVGNASSYSFGANTLTVGASGGSGNFFYRGNMCTCSTAALNIYGNFLWTVTNPGYQPPFSTVNMYGTSKGFSNTTSRYGFTQINVYGTTFDNGSYDLYDNRNVISVKSGGKLIKRPDGTASRWVAFWYDLADGQANLPNWSDCVTIQYSGNSADNGIDRAAIRGGVTYGYDLTISHGYSNTRKTTDFVFKVEGGSFKVGRDFTVTSNQYQTTNPALRGNFGFSSLENGTNNSVDFEVCQDLKVGVAAGSGLDCTPLSIIKLNNSTVHVGRDAIFGWRSDAYYQSNGVADLGSSTVYLGRNFTMYDPQAPVRPAYQWVIDTWNAGTSTIICDGNGPSRHYTQTIQTYSYKVANSGKRIALNNLIVRNPGGVVQLANSRAGELLLTGNLTIDCGTFNDNDRAITFNGPDHHLKIDPSATITGGSLDNIILLTNAVLRLDSNATMDNIEMQTGSKLYLQGFTLVVEGQAFISGQISDQGIPYTALGSNGTIYGTFTIPEPTTLLLLGTGALGAFGYIRRRRMA